MWKPVPVHQAKRIELVREAFRQTRHLGLIWHASSRDQSEVAAVLVAIIPGVGRELRAQWCSSFAGQFTSPTVAERIRSPQIFSDHLSEAIGEPFRGSVCSGIPTTQPLNLTDGSRTY
jgi:hypothetical protein